MEIKVIGGNLSQDEVNFYTEKIKRDNPDKLITEVTIKVNGDKVDVKYTYDSKPFVRIRRITGYLVGDLNRFNNAKRAEVADRVKHTLSEKLL